MSSPLLSPSLLFTSLLFPPSPTSQIRLVVEEGLNQLPYSDCSITTPTGCQYEGLQFVKGNCGVSIVRSGEAMEQVRCCICTNAAGQGVGGGL